MRSRVHAGAGLVASGCIWLLMTAQPALAAESTAPGSVLAGVLPPDRVADVLRQAPAYRAALSDVDVARAQQQQWAAGEPAWAATLASTRRRDAQLLPEHNNEWEVGLQRTVRLPGKAPVYAGAGRARLGQAQAGVQRAWREQSRELLDTLGNWLRATEGARQWQRQIVLLTQQRDAVARRQRLGAAALLEQHQADAALAQARARAAAAFEQALATREALVRRFPGLDPSVEPQLPEPAPLADTDAVWTTRLQAANSELAAAREAVAVADALARVEQAEQRPDPSVAVRVGRARNGGEQVLGLSLSVPFGSDARDAVARAGAARAMAALRQQDDAQRLAEVQAAQQLRAARAAHAAWLAQTDAAQRLRTAADGVARAFQLGEGSLAEVLAARRLATEQELEAALASVDAWLLRSRLELEAGLLWPHAPQPETRSAP